LIIEASEFVFQPPPLVSRARRVLIKPRAASIVPYPANTSLDILTVIIEGIRRVSDADIVILEGSTGGEAIYPIYQQLGYNFPRVLMLDVKDCISVEVDNPLPKPLVVPTFSVPNVILSSDYLITVTPLKATNGKGNLSIMNLISLLPGGKYSDGTAGGWETLYQLGIDKVIADLYFTLPFDLGIIQAQGPVTISEGLGRAGKAETDKIFIGEPYQVDREASQTFGLDTPYLDIIEQAKVEFEPEIL
jgi:hypothetical protein